MACTRPINAWYSETGGVSFGSSDRFTDRPVIVPCGVCLSCLNRRRMDWAIRVVHSLQVDGHGIGSFLTLTYSPENLPSSELLEVDALQRFIKRLRHHTPAPLSYLAAGEYGSKTLRPHYHICMIGYRPEQIGPGTNEELEEIWGLGRVHAGELNIASAAYAAKYVTKGASAPPHRSDDPCDPPVRPLRKEFLLSSRRPALGRNWIEKYWPEVYRPEGASVRLDGTTYAPPKYYDKWCRENQPEAYAACRDARIRLSVRQAKRITNDRKTFKAREVTQWRNRELFSSSRSSSLGS